MIGLAQGSFQIWVLKNSLFSVHNVIIDLYIFNNHMLILCVLSSFMTVISRLMWF